MTCASFDQGLRHLSTFFSTVPWQMVAWPSSDYVLLLLANIVVHMEEFKSNWQHISDHLNICLMRQSTVSVIEVRSHESESTSKLMCLKHVLSILQFLINVYYCYHLTVYKIIQYIIYWISALVLCVFALIS